MDISQIVVITFSHEIPAEEKGVIEQRAPITGLITELTFCFPKDSEGLLELRFRTENSSVPNNGVMALDSQMVVSMYPQVPVMIGGKLMVEVNNKTEKPLRPTVLATIGGEGIEY